MNDANGAALFDEIEAAKSAGCAHVLCVPKSRFSRKLIRVALTALARLLFGRLEIRA